jgi:hypothetical protein
MIVEKDNVSSSYDSILLPYITKYLQQDSGKVEIREHQQHLLIARLEAIKTHEKENFGKSITEQEEIAATLKQLASKDLGFDTIAVLWINRNKIAERSTSTDVPDIINKWVKNPHIFQKGLYDSVQKKKEFLDAQMTSAQIDAGQGEQAIVAAMDGKKEHLDEWLNLQKISQALLSLNTPSGLPLM